MQGIAQALWEEAVFDDNGTLVTGSFVDYTLPTAADTISFVTENTTSPSTTNTLGTKGVGEAGTIASTPAVVNAIVDACYRSASSRQWEPVLLDEWRGKAEVSEVEALPDYDAEHIILKEETLPDGRRKLILRHKTTGEVTEQFV